MRPDHLAAIVQPVPRMDSLLPGKTKRINWNCIPGSPWNSRNNLEYWAPDDSPLINYEPAQVWERKMNSILLLLFKCVVSDSISLQEKDNSPAPIDHFQCISLNTMLRRDRHRRWIYHIEDKDWNTMLLRPPASKSLKSNAFCVATIFLSSITQSTDEYSTANCSLVDNRPTTAAALECETAADEFCRRQATIQLNGRFVFIFFLSLTLCPYTETIRIMNVITYRWSHLGRNTHTLLHNYIRNERVLRVWV